MSGKTLREKEIKMYQLIDGKLLAQKNKRKIKKEVEDLKAINIVPKLAVILVGNDSASKGIC